MKKLFFFAATAMMLAACTSEELSQSTPVVANDATVNFDVYALRGTTRAGTPGDIDNDNIGDIGFGVFAYYTNNKTYDKTATPNFMYNQKVTKDGDDWVYEPVKYWPNEYGNAAISDDVDYVTFFSYAPWTEVEPTTGRPVVADGLTEDQIANIQNYNIIEVKKNTDSGDPIIKYRVDTNPATSVDLLWGVNADPDTYAPIDDANTDPQNVEGMPFIDLIKPSDPVDGKIKFNLKHALAKVKVTIDYIADAETPDGDSEEIKADETRIYVRWLQISGFALEGALNLNNTEAGEPLWKDIDGEKELDFSEAITFNDGRKDGKEGTENGSAKEANLGLNENIVENWAQTVDGKFTDDKTTGVTKETQLVFGGDESENDGFFYVIPRGEDGGSVDVKINYDVLTLDPNLAGELAGTKDRGSEINNQIYKEDIFDGIDFEAGKQYEIHIHIGMTSVKIDAEVNDWDDSTDPAEVELPANQ